MALRDPGIPARDYANNRPTIAVKLYEGNLVYNPSGFGEDGRSRGMWTVSAPMHNGQFVELHEDSNARDIIVKPATAKSTEIVGRFIIEPKLGWTPDWSDKEINRLPRENKSWSHYVPRSGTVEFRGDAIDYLDLVDDNQAIAPLDYVAYVDEDKFDKASQNTTTNSIALAGVKANKGGKVPVLANYYGI